MDVPVLTGWLELGGVTLRECGAWTEVWHVGERGGDPGATDPSARGAGGMEGWPGAVTRRGLRARGFRASTGVVTLRACRCKRRPPRGMKSRASFREPVSMLQAFAVFHHVYSSLVSRFPGGRLRQKNAFPPPWLLAHTARRLNNPQGNQGERAPKWKHSRVAAGTTYRMAAMPPRELLAPRPQVASRAAPITPPPSLVNHVSSTPCSTTSAAHPSRNPSQQPSATP